MQLKEAKLSQSPPALGLVDELELNMSQWNQPEAALHQRGFAERRAAAGIALFGDTDLARLGFAKTADGHDRAVVMAMRDEYDVLSQAAPADSPEKQIYLARYLQLASALGNDFEAAANPAGMLACQRVLSMSDDSNFAELPPVLQMRVIYALEKASQVAITYEHNFDKAKTIIEDALQKFQKLDRQLFDVDDMSALLQINLAVVNAEFENIEAASAALSEARPASAYKLLLKQLVGLDLLRKAAVQSDDAEFLQVSEDKVRATLANFGGGELPHFFEAAKKDNPADYPRQQARLQKELLLLLAASGKRTEYENVKTRFAVEWTNTLNPENTFDAAVFAAELLMAEARFFHVDEPEVSLAKQREAAAQYDAIDFDFHSAETLLNLLEAHHADIPEKQAKQDFHEAWRVLEKRFNRRLVAEWRTAEDAPPLFQKMMRVLELTYGEASVNPLDTWQRATNEHGKYIERQLQGYVTSKLAQTAVSDLPTFAERTQEAFGSAMYRAELPEDGEELNFAAVNEGENWSLQLSAPEIAELKKTGRLHKNFFFTDSAELQPVAHAFLMLHGRDVFLFHRDGRLLPFSETDENILLTNLVAGLEGAESEPDAKLLRRPQNISHLHLNEHDPRFQEAVEISCACYLRDLGFLSVTAGGYIPVAVDAHSGQIIGGAAIELMQDHELSYPEIFMCCGGEDGRALLLSELEKRGVALNEIVESGSFFMTAEYRGDEVAATHALQAIAEQAKELGAKYIFLAYHRLPEAIFKRAGIDPQPIKEVTFDEHVIAALKARGMTDEIVERVRQGYFARRAIQPIKAGLIGVEQTLVATAAHLATFAKA